MLDYRLRDYIAEPPGNVKGPCHQPVQGTFSVLKEGKGLARLDHAVTRNHKVSHLGIFEFRGRNAEVI